MTEGLDKIFATGATREEVLTYQGVEIKLIVRDLTWYEKTNILENSAVFEEGRQKFLLGKFYKDCLKKMIVKAPWGITDENFFTRITGSFGSMLEKLVPKPDDDKLKNLVAREPEESSKDK